MLILVSDLLAVRQAPR